MAKALEAAGLAAACVPHIRGLVTPAGRARYDQSVRCRAPPRGDRVFPKSAGRWPGQLPRAVRRTGFGEGRAIGFAHVGFTRLAFGVDFGRRRVGSGCRDERAYVVGEP